MHCTSWQPNDTHRMGERDAPSSADSQRKLEQLCRACADIFESTRHIADCYREEQRRFFYATPASFLRFLDGVCYIYMHQASQHHHQQQLYELGLHRLREVSSQVMEMQQQLEMLQPELIKASQETQQLMQELTLQQTHAATTMVGTEELRNCSAGFVFKTTSVACSISFSFRVV